MLGLFRLGQFSSVYISLGLISSGLVGLRQFKSGYMKLCYVRLSQGRSG